MNSILKCCIFTIFLLTEAIAEILHMPMASNNALGAGSDVPRMKSVSNADADSESSVVLEKSNILMLGPTGSGE